MQFPSIYKILNKLDGKYYVGSSTNPHRRWKNHKRSLNLNQHHNDYLQNSWNKYGENSFDFIIVQSFPNISPAELLSEEQKWLNIASSDILSYNLTFIAGNPNLLLSNYSKKKRSESLKKVIKTPEWKNKISQSHIGICPSLASRKKMSISHIGKKQSDTHKNNATESRRKNWIFISPSQEIIHIHDLSRFCQLHGLHKGNMCDVYKGIRPHHKQWRKYDIS